MGWLIIYAVVAVILAGFLIWKQRAVDRCIVLAVLWPVVLFGGLGSDFGGSLRHMLVSAESR